MAINKSDDIEKCYDDILLIDPNYVRGNVNIAAYYQSVNKDLLAIKYYEKALILDPLNVMAKHGLLSLNNIGINSQKNQNSENDLKNGLNQNYIIELFDSYSFHFENSLLLLDYQSHNLVAKSVGKYISNLIQSKSNKILLKMIKENNKNEIGKNLDKKNVITEAKLEILNKNEKINSQLLNVNSTKYDVELNIFGLDLGAGTGLACLPIKNEILKNVHLHNTELNKKKNLKINENENENRNGLSMSYEDELDGEYNNLDGDNITILPYIAIIGVDLSSKMLKKSEEKKCYVDTVVDDVAKFVQDYAANVNIKTNENDKNSNDNNDNNNFDSKNKEKMNENVDIDADSKNGNKSEIDNENYPMVDFITAVDVFMYLGDLKNVLESSCKILNYNGLLVFTVEALKNEKLKIDEIESEVEIDIDLNGLEFNIKNQNEKIELNYSLLKSGRIAHSYEYIENVAIASNFEIVEISEQTPRFEKGKGVDGFLVVLKKTSICK